MGAFLIILLINELVRKRFGYGVRGSLLAFGIAAAISVPAAAFGFSDGSVTPMQQLPFVALGYGKFCLAFLVMDLYNARKLEADPAFLRTRGRLGFRPSIAWIAAVLIVAVGAALSYQLPQPVDGSRSERNPLAATSNSDWRTIESPNGLFRAQFPGEPAVDSTTQLNPTGRPPVMAILLSMESSEAYYALQHMTMSDAHVDRTATVERVLESTRDGMIRGMAAQSARLLSNRPMMHEGWPALEAAFEVHDSAATFHGRARYVIVGRTLYTLLVLGASDAATSRFLDSFHVVAASDTMRLPRRAQPE